MLFDFSDEQKAFGETLRRLLSEQCPCDHVRAVYESPVGYSPHVWRQLAQMGALGAAIPEEYGGAGFGPLEQCVIACELGRAMAPVPFLSCIALGVEALLLAGSAEQKQAWLPAIARGETILTFADATRPRCTARLEGGRVTGMVPFMADAAIPAHAVLYLPDGSGATHLGVVAMRSESVQIDEHASIDRTRRLAHVAFDAADFVPLAACGSASEALEQLYLRAAVLVAFEQLGGAERALEAAVDYAKKRSAFGRPIGSFQAIKHMLADMFVEVTLARSNCYFGAWALGASASTLPYAAPLARLSATSAFDLCAVNGLQVHGGIGFTWESDCHLFYRRANALSHALGTQAEWRDRLIEAMQNQDQQGASSS